MNIIIAGDFCPRFQTAEKFENNDFSFVLGEVRQAIRNADFSIVNFECPVTKGNEKPIDKIGPTLHCSAKGIEAVRWAGFDAVTLANNHLLDYGGEGVLNTINACKSNGLETVGGGNNEKKAAQTLYKKIRNKTLAVINCCENEFSIATEYTAGANALNVVKQFYAIKEAREKADYVVVIVHGGHERFQLPSPRMKETYRFFVDAGADAVVNHHQHCYSGYEVYHKKPIFYGLGNFCFEVQSKLEKAWYEGYMVSINFGEEIHFNLIPYKQCYGTATINILSEDSFSKDLEELNHIIADDERLRQEVMRYYDKSEGMYSSILEPINSKYYDEIKRRGWLPSFITKKRMLKATDYICCESHRDRLIHYLLSKSKK